MPWPLAFRRYGQDKRIRLRLMYVFQCSMCEPYNKDVQQDLGVFLIETNEADGSITLTALDALFQ